MKCSTCKVELQLKTEDISVDLQNCSVHQITASFSECPDCKTKYATPEQMLSFAQKCDGIEQKHKKK